MQEVQVDTVCNVEGFKVKAGVHVHLYTKQERGRSELDEKDNSEIRGSQNVQFFCSSASCFVALASCGSVQALDYVIFFFFQPGTYPCLVTEGLVDMHVA